MSRATKQRIDGLYCLLAEQVLPHERLLWRGCPATGESSAERVNRYRYGSVLKVAPLRVTGICSGLAVLVFFNTRGNGPPTDIAVAAAIMNAFFTFFLTLLLCLAANRILQMARAGDIPWPIWRWRPISQLLWPHRANDEQGNSVPLMEPTPAFERNAQMIYGLTDQRVIVLLDGQRRSLYSYWLHEISGVRCIDACDGWGDLALVMEESASTSDDAEWEEIRLWGIERAHWVAEALRCLLAHQPLHDAIAALTCGWSATEPSDGDVRRNDGLPRSMMPKVRMWQATFWQGSCVSELEPCIVYGSSLAQLREQARARLMTIRPACLANGLAPTSQNTSRMSFCQLALYQCSTDESQGAAELLEPSSLTSLSAQMNGTQEAFQSTSQGSPLEQPDSLEDGAMSTPQLEEQPRREAVWIRNAWQNASTSPSIFRTFDKAVEYFVARDLLAEKGPAYEDVLLEQGSQWLNVQTVRVVDDEALANELLRRGGWHVLTTMGMTAPRGQRGPVLFVLGHPESDAV